MGPNKTTYLKSLFIFIMEMMEPTNDFVPRGSEGIVDVQWFSLSEARRAVTHRSLFPVLNEVELYLASRKTHRLNLSFRGGLRRVFPSVFNGAKAIVNGGHVMCIVPNRHA